MSVRSWKLLTITLVLLSAICLAALSMTIWWARTTVQTAEAQLQVERQNVEALKGYAELIKKKLDEGRKENPGR